MLEAFACSLGWYPSIYRIAAQVNYDLVGIVLRPRPIALQIFERFPRAADGVVAGVIELRQQRITEWPISHCFSPFIFLLRRSSD